MPGAQAYDLVLETADGRHILFDCPTAIPAGQMASAYLKRIDTLVRADGKFGLIDATGKPVIPAQYDWLNWPQQNPYSPFLIAHTEKGWSLLDRTGKELLPPKYDRLFGFTGNKVIFQQGGKFGLVTTTGQEVIPAKYEVIGSYGGNGASVRQDGRWGMINDGGTEIVPPKYSYIMQFYGNRALVASGGAWREGVGKPMLAGAKWGIIDSNGAEIIPPQYDWIYPWGNELLPVARDVERMIPQP